MAVVFGRRKLTRADLSNLRMTTGGEKTHPKVILDGIVREWVGFGWIDCDPPSKEDLAKLPLVDR